MLDRKNVFLVGPMGAGKTTVGRLLGELLRQDFFDSDAEIEKATGADIPWIFDVEGEVGFRKRERKMIDFLTSKENIVLATGGGSVTAEESRRMLRERGDVVYLRASIDQQIRRMSGDNSRPLLQVEDRETQIRQLFAIRDPLYKEVSDISIETNGRNARFIAKEIHRQLNKISR
ncbi:MAG: shikimate kinase AroK [Gammaproteobacteria bacterium]|nr:shikimate kinase AroK [Gammaproteobacteria bacterium]MDG0997755.1 shikimate kinase AroK [Gammaproteobacteria bacterium]MDG1952373.1 shikimate kinase AroK [Gammaproteobacteria bacterium]MDG2118471.1 shikimate kinase AroK [Gammaproteobacteria bacterium]